ncbi:MAG TPA: HAMP domain-containing sensor histidine kinase, partial [Polyangiaceae bacterium]|nr:HAMP domain-containing sensor histidine kinase [Polyangiaceae bacterium]
HAERLAELGKIVGAVAHEIRNPLGVMLAHAKLLERSGADDEAVAGLRVEIARARRFLDDLLRYGKPRPLALERRRVLEIVESAAIGAASGMGVPRADVAIEGDAALEADVDADALTDVVTALVSNALIATSALDAGSPRVTVRARRDLERAEIAVEDRGPGVPREIEPRLFEPFVTGRGRDAEHPGTGLGLAIAARWAARHGGSLRHERPATGARFVFEWPVAATVAGPSEPRETREPA